MFGTLRQKVDPKCAALLVVDVQNDFCSPGGAMAREGCDLTAVQEMIPTLKTLIRAAESADVFRVYVQSVYGTAGSGYLSEAWLEQAERTRKGGSYTTFPVCARNSWGADFYGGVMPREGDVIVRKHRFDAFQSTPLDLILRSRGIRTVIMTGVSTNVCVETTAREAFVKDYHVVFVRDCSGTYHNQDHEMTLRNIDHYFGEVTSHETIANVWRDGGREKVERGT